nr:endogenous retrovirus group K member 6 Gag polyprotein-like [Dasypus novemcinctus]
MGASFSSQQAPQVQVLAGLLACHQCKVSAKQLQTYWDLLIPFNPWLSTANLWDPDTYCMLVDRVSAAMEHENKRFPPGLIPTLIAIHSCLLGAALPVTAYNCDQPDPLEQGNSDPMDNDSASLVFQLNNILEEDEATPGPLLPSKIQNDLAPKGHLAVEQNGNSATAGSLPSANKQDGELPPSSSSNTRKSLYPELPPSPSPDKQEEVNLKEEPLPHSPSTGAVASGAEMRAGLHNPSLSNTTAPPSGSPMLTLSLPSTFSPALNPTLAFTPSTLHPLTLPPVAPPPMPLTFHQAMPPPQQPPQLYPVNLMPTPQCPLPWYLYSPSEVKRLREAIWEDGLGSPYAQQLLNDILLNLNLPYDWQAVARAILTPGQFVNWRAHFQDQAEQQVRANHPNGITFPLNAFLGLPPYNVPAAFAQATAVFWDQLRSIAMRAFGNCSAIKTETFTKLIQGKEEDFSAFVSRVQEACARKVTNEQAQAALAWELILEGANPVCKQAIASKWEGSLHEWILACKDLDQTSHTLATSFASALALAMGPCFQCNQEGHFARNCPNSKGAPPPKRPLGPNTPSTPCPKCKRGYHWARDCHSRSNINGKPLNFKGGKPQPRPQEAHHLPKP